jgi:GntR family transcriptional regulator
VVGLDPGEGAPGEPGRGRRGEVVMARRATVPRRDHVLARDRRPLYLQAVEAIQRLVADRNLRPGDHLPSEVELAAVFGVGRSTIREAMGHLELGRVVERRRGVGTVLVGGESPAAVGLETLESLESLAARQGWHCETRNLRIQQAEADPEQARRLEVAVGSPVALITRTKCRDGVPIAEMVSMVPDAIVPFAALEREFESSITELMTRRHSPPVRLARAEVTALACERGLARRLRIRQGDPVLVMDELFLGDGDIALAWNVLYFVPTSIRLEVIRRARRLHATPASWVDGWAGRSGASARGGKPHADAAPALRRSPSDP